MIEDTKLVVRAYIICLLTVLLGVLQCFIAQDNRGVIALDIVVFVSVICLIYYLVKGLKDRLKLVAAIIFILGIAVHFWGFCKDFTAPVPSTIIRSVIASAKMFLMESSLDEIIIEDKDLVETHQWFISLYVFIFSAAIAVSAYFLLSIFGKRIQSQMWLKSHTPTEKTNGLPTKWFIMYGVNDNSLLLAEDLLKHEGYFVIFLDEPPKGDSVKRLSFSELRDFFTVKESTAERIRKVFLNAGILNTAWIVLKLRNGFPKVVELCMDNAISVGEFVKEIGLPGLDRFLYCTNISLFIIGEDESKNIDVCRSLLHIEKDINCHVYCAAHRPSHSYGLYPLVLGGNSLVVEYIEHTRLSLEQIKKYHTNDGVYPFHPINFVEKDLDKGCVISTLHGLVLGFGHAGQAALDFLYSFGAFVGKDQKRSPFEFLVYDNEMPDREGEYRFRRCGMDYSNIRFINALVGSQDFWHNLSKVDETFFKSAFIERVNYIFVTLGNDQLNFETGLSLCDFIYQNRKSRTGGKLIILVHMFRVSPEQEKLLGLYSCKYPETTIVVFGRIDDIWLYDVVTSYSQLNEAAVFYNAYQEASGNDEYKDFLVRHEEIYENAKRLGSTSDRKFLEKVLKSRRQETQDRENTLHQYTKLQLCREDIRQYYALIPSKYNINGDKEMVHFPKDNGYEKIYNILENLAIGEHIRWQASHETLGYVYGNKTNDIYRTHCCIMPYSQLNEIDKRNAGETGDVRLGETKHYDWIVIKTTLMLNCKINENENA